MKTKLVFLICLFIQSVSMSSVQAFDYVLSLEGSGTVDETLLPGDIIDISLDTTDLGTIYGSMQIVFDPDMLEALYVDETHLYYGFFTAWSQQPGNPELCGGGQPYYYFTDGGSDRADAYADEYGEGVAGPSGYIDNANGIIRFYQFNYLTPGNYEPLRIGFRLLRTGNTTLRVDSQANTVDFWWCDFDTTASFEFTLGQQLPYDFIELALILEELVKEEIDVSNAVRHSYLAHIHKLISFFEKDLTTALLNQLEALIFKIEKDLVKGRISQSDGQALLDIIHLMIEIVETP